MKADFSVRTLFQSRTVTRPELEVTFVAPRTPIEGLLTKIWAHVLKIEGVGVHDNFFDLGGHSLAATRVLSQVMKRFQLELPLRSLLEAPPVAEMATVITGHQEKEIGGGEAARVLTEIESLSDEETGRLLSDESRGKLYVPLILLIPIRLVWIPSASTSIFRSTLPRRCAFAFLIDTQIIL